MEKLTIHSLVARAVLVPLDPPLTTASGVVAAAPLVLIDLKTEEGVTGCAYVFCYSPVVMGPIAETLRNIGDLVKGAAVAPQDLDRLLRARFRLLGVQGLVGMAMAGFDMAAWDALAKAAGLPLVSLLGGTVCAVPVYDSHSMLAADQAAAAAAESHAKGFGAIKVKIGHPGIAEDLAVIRATRDAAGPDMAIMVDYNQSLSVPEAMARARILDDEGLAWIEEPTIAEDFAGHAKIADAARTAVQLGENWWGLPDMQKAIAAGASDLAMIDVMKIGGVTGWMKAAALAEGAGLPVSSHLWPEVSAHLLAVTPGAHLLEYLDLAAPVLQQPAQVQGGKVVIRDEPGSGVAWDEAAVSRYAAD
ncbi:mandelate racemase [Pelagibius litoralis]|uniref:Mandelate racemase n=1 Tax=Pelagibius litoralis TaxID=374515 RepID=A0A967F0J8_9PROT|nr:enolase C-terminal domain-like protein [Pelagibius litoralis]NIA70787.1 mandelate racemase [Pelagibius litoralis]